ncbi:hypothetical protein PSP20601_01999 [Pandoraea sputorum]|nr:hypothetical protein PSP20601_01999 [Pandoraea sputorum]
MSALSIVQHPPISIDIVRCTLPSCIRLRQQRLVPTQHFALVRERLVQTGQNLQESLCRRRQALLTCFIELLSDHRAYESRRIRYQQASPKRVAKAAAPVSGCRLAVRFLKCGRQVVDRIGTASPRLLRVSNLRQLRNDLVTLLRDRRPPFVHPHRDIHSIDHHREMGIPRIIQIFVVHASPHFADVDAPNAAQDSTSLLN